MGLHRCMKASGLYLLSQRSRAVSTGSRPMDPSFLFRRRLGKQTIYV